MDQSSELTFQECETCSTKSGIPLLCAGCLHNRTAIENLTKRMLEARKTAEDVEQAVADKIQILEHALIEAKTLLCDKYEFEAAAKFSKALKCK